MIQLGRFHEPSMAVHGEPRSTAGNGDEIGGEPQPGGPECVEDLNKSSTHSGPSPEVVNLKGS